MTAMVEASVHDGLPTDDLRLAAIVVCYLPNLSHVSDLCERISGNGMSVYLVDNSPKSALDTIVLPEGCQVMALGFNSGIAHAQNIGLAAATADGAQCIAFFDQDSTVAGNLVRDLSKSLRIGTPDIVSPACIDDITGHWLAAERLRPIWGLKSVFPEGAREPYEVDVVISSGTVATVDVFAIAGGMDETFFIDFVDSEWCLRCRARGIPIRVIPTVVMHHRIGAPPVSVAGRSVQVHSAARCYYQIRNAMSLFRKDWVPFSYALRQVCASIASCLLLAVHVSNKRRYLKACLVGVFYGLTGRHGPMPDDLL